VDTLLDDFCLYIASEKGLAPNSVAAYRRDTQAFAEFLRGLGVADFSQVTCDHIIAYLAKLKGEEYAVSSVSRALVAVKVLFRFLKREGAVKIDSAHYLESPKLWQVIPDVLSCSEVEALLEQPNPRTETGARDKAIIELLYGCGLRVTELCTLSIYDVDDTFIRAFGKGRKERLVPIGKKAIEAVDHYLLHFRSRYESEKLQQLFLTRSGKPIDRITVWKVIKEHAKNAGIMKNISPHSLRHSFATHLLDNGADLRVIQEMLGHADIGSTDRYMHVSRSHIKEAFMKFHPNP